MERESCETVCQTPMYEAFYGFQENPFRLTPDPRYLFLSANHQEALGHLLFGVHEGNGVVVLTGEIGAGKTTLLRTLAGDLDASTTLAYLFNPALSDVELLQAINADLGLSADSTSKRELTDELNRFLLAQQAAGRRVVAVIQVHDEQERQPLPSQAQVDVIWSVRGRDDLLATVEALPLPEGTLYAWVALEKNLTRQVKTLLISKGVAQDALKAAAYWRAEGSASDD